MPTDLIASDVAAPSKTVSENLQIGMIVDLRFGSKYAYQIAEWAREQSDISISHLIIQEGLDTRAGRFAKLIKLIHRHGLLKIARQLSFKVITDLETLLLRRSPIHSDHRSSFNLTPVVAAE